MWLSPGVLARESLLLTRSALTLSLKKRRQTREAAGGDQCRPTPAAVSRLLLSVAAGQLAPGAPSGLEWLLHRDSNPKPGLVFAYDYEPTGGVEAPRVWISDDVQHCCALGAGKPAAVLD